VGDDDVQTLIRTVIVCVTVMKMGVDDTDGLAVALGERLDDADWLELGEPVGVCAALGDPLSEADVETDAVALPETVTVAVVVMVTVTRTYDPLGVAVSDGVGVGTGVGVTEPEDVPEPEPVTVTVRVCCSDRRTAKKRTGRVKTAEKPHHTHG